MKNTIALRWVEDQEERPNAVSTFWEEELELHVDIRAVMI